MTNKTYDILKWVAQIVLPALGTFVAGIFALYHLPYGEQVVGTITLIDAFLGALLKISSDGYSGDGELIVDKSDPFKDVYSISIPDYPDVLASKDKIMLSVRHPAHLAPMETDVSED